MRERERFGLLACSLLLGYRVSKLSVVIQPLIGFKGSVQGWMKCHLEQDIPQTPPNPQPSACLLSSSPFLSVPSCTPPCGRMFDLVLYPAVVINHLPKKRFCITNVPFKLRKTNKEGKKKARFQGACLKRRLFLLWEQQWQVETWQTNCRCKHKTKCLCVASEALKMQILERAVYRDSTLQMDTPLRVTGPSVGLFSPCTRPNSDLLPIRALIPFQFKGEREHWVPTVFTVVLFWEIGPQRTWRSM